MAETFYKGETQILYIFVGGEKIPVACLQDNSLIENVDMLETTTQDNKGWKTGRPLNQSYRISFSGVQIETNFAAPTKASLDILKPLKRKKILINWTIETESTFVEGGSGHIVSLIDSGSSEGLLTFSGEILGYGPMLEKYLAIPESFVFQNGDTYVFQNGDNYIFN